VLHRLLEGVLVGGRPWGEALAQPETANPAERAQQSRAGQALRDAVSRRCASGGIGGPAGVGGPADTVASPV